MILLLDLGNSRLKWALTDGRQLQPMQADVVGAPVELPSADSAVLASSSADPARFEWLQSRLQQAGCGPLRRLGPPRSDALLRLAYADPATLGVDRWLAMRAARSVDSGACVVVSVGTALTVDAIDASGRQLGGCIAPGPTAMREVLLARAPHLRDAGGRLLDFPLSTEDAVYSGPLLAAAALIERQHRLLARRCAVTPRLLLTGGGADLVREALQLGAERIPDLVLRGMLTCLAEGG